MNYLSELSDFLKEIFSMNIFLSILTLIIGAWLGAWLHAKYARRTRMNQIVAEKAVNANAEAYAYMKDIEARLTQDTLENTFAAILQQGEWLLKSRLYLPGKFPNKWFAIRNKLGKAVRLEKQLPKTDTQKTTEELGHLEEELKRLVDEAIGEIYKEMKLSHIKPG